MNAESSVVASRTTAAVIRPRFAKSDRHGTAIVASVVGMSGKFAQESDTVEHAVDSWIGKTYGQERLPFFVGK